MNEPLLTPDEVAAHLVVPVETLRYWRAMSRGPKYIRVGRHVRYRPTDIEQYLSANSAA